MFYKSKIFDCLDFNREKRVNRTIFGETFRMEDVLLIYFEQIVSFSN